MAQPTTTNQDRETLVDALAQALLPALVGICRPRADSWATVAEQAFELAELFVTLASARMTAAKAKDTAANARP